MDLWEDRLLEIMEKINTLLERECSLLEAETVNWETLEQNLTRIGELFSLLSLNQDILETAAGQPKLTAMLIKIDSLRRENMEILRLKAELLGRKICSFKQGKEASLAYIDHQLPTTPSPKTTADEV